MTIHLDPKFLKVIALWRSTTHPGEKAAAQARAEAMAAAAGMTFEQAVAAADAPAPDLRNIFAGFDDWCEEREPGYKAREAAKRSEEERARLERRAAILTRYGSEEAALAPCAREQMLHAALGPLRKPCEPPWQRWTSSVDGYSCFEPLPPNVRKAVVEAYSMPSAFADAMAEHDSWNTRRQEIEDVLGPGNYGDSGLDLCADIRFDLIRDLVEHEIETKTLDELHARFRHYRGMECNNEKIEAALFRDLEALLLTKHLANECDAKPCPHPSTGGDRNEQVCAALDADPTRSDRNIARACGCSPTTVGKVRRAMGLHCAARSVHRGGQTFQMHFAFEDRR